MTRKQLVSIIKCEICELLLIQCKCEEGNPNFINI